MTSDFLLLQKIRNGNNHAGNQFVEKYYSFIYQYCFLHIHNQECAEDMVQETFVRFFGALMSGAEIGKAKSYLYSIAGNIIKNYYKKKKEILLDQLPDIEKDNLTGTGVGSASGRNKRDGNLVFLSGVKTKRNF